MGKEAGIDKVLGAAITRVISFGTLKQKICMMCEKV